MPYTKEDLEKHELSYVKNLYQQIQAHKSALPDEDIQKGYEKKTLVNRREQLAKAANRMDLIFDKQKYQSIIKKKDKKDYLIKKILEIQDSPFIGRHKDASKHVQFDYVIDVDEPRGVIDPNTGHVKYPKLSEFKKKEEAEVAKSEVEEAEVEKPYP